jgi:hypothetical protein
LNDKREKGTTVITANQRGKKAFKRKVMCSCWNVLGEKAGERE